MKISKYKLKKYNSQIDVSGFKYKTNICNDILEIESNSLSSVNDYYSPIEILFNLKKDISYQSIKKDYERIKEIVYSGEKNIIILKGLLLLIPIYNRNWQFYLNKNLSTKPNLYSGLIFYDDEKIIYLLDKTSTTDGIKYTYFFETDETHVEYDSINVIERGLYLKLKENIFFPEIEDRFTIRGNIVDIHDSYFMLKRTTNSNLL